jgi:hypothetical protein
MFIKGITFALGSVVGLFVVLPLILLCLWLLGLIFFQREAKKPADPVIKMSPRQLTDEDRQIVIDGKQREKDRLERLKPLNPAPPAKAKEWHEAWMSESIEQRRERIEKGLGGPFD